MAVAKVIELISEGETIEKAVEAAVAQASETLQKIQHVWVEGIKAQVEDGKVVRYRTDVKITFLVEH